MCIGHFHSGTTQTGNAQINPSSHGHQVRMSNDTGNIGNFNSTGGFVLDESPLQTYGANTGAAGDARGQQIAGQTISDSGHTHTINTWGILYDNTSYPGGGWTAIGGDNVSTQSAVTNRNIPPYISLKPIRLSFSSQIPKPCFALSNASNMACKAPLSVITNSN